MSTELDRKTAPSAIKWKPLGHLLGPSPHGGWFQVEPGNWQHFSEPPAKEQLNEERAWLEERRKRAAEEAARASGEKS
jgi:hypothetical protein